MQADKMTVKLRDAFGEAAEVARNAGHAELTTWHLFLELFKAEAGLASSLLKRMGVAMAPLMKDASDRLARLPARKERREDVTVAEDLRRLLRDAEQVKSQGGDGFLGIEHVLQAAVGDGSDHAIGRLLKEHGVTLAKLRAALAPMKGEGPSQSENPEDQYQALERFTKDLTKLAADGKIDPVIGRDAEIRRVMQVLSRRTKNNPVLVGEPGVGKTAIAEGLARRIVEGDVPEGLKHCRVLSLDMGALVAGAKFRGDFEERLDGVLKAVRGSDGEIILFIDEIHTVVGAGRAEGSQDAANMMKPALARGELRCIGATTLDEYRKNIEKDAALERRFQKVMVDEPSVEETIAILRGLKERYEVHHGVRVRDAALIAAATLSHRYITDRQLPDKAIDLVDEALSRLRIEIDSTPQELDALERQVTTLSVEEQALARESDRASADRLKVVKEELANLRERVAILRQRWLGEKDIIQNIRGEKERLESLKRDMEQRLREGDLLRVSEIKHSEIPRSMAALESFQGQLRTLQGDHAMLKEEIGEEEIALVVSQWVGVPVTRLLEGERERLMTLETKLHDRVIGQDRAVQVVSDAVRRQRAGLADENRPAGAFLFVGPTGVGKTELAKALAELLFDDERAMVRLDMSEYQEKHTVSRLVGAPPGYVGHEEGGQLTEAVRRRPYCVILLDEVEKAHADVFHTLLQVLDDGRITDSMGRTVNFRNAIIIMTSNLGTGGHGGSGAPEVFESASMREQAEARAMASVERFFRPEFLNRLDDIVHFHPLGREELKRILDIQIRPVARKLKDRNIALAVTGEAKERLIGMGFDPVYGARPLKRVLKRELVDRLARGILEGVLSDGDTATLDVGPTGDLVLERSN